MLKEKFGSRQQLLKVNSFLFSCRGKPSQCFMSDGLIQVYLDQEMNKHSSLKLGTMWEENWEFFLGFVDWLINDIDDN